MAQVEHGLLAASHRSVLLMIPARLGVSTHLNSHQRSNVEHNQIQVSNKRCSIPSRTRPKRVSPSKPTKPRNSKAAPKISTRSEAEISELLDATHARRIGNHAIRRSCSLKSFPLLGLTYKQLLKLRDIIHQSGNGKQGHSRSPEENARSLLHIHEHQHRGLSLIQQ